MSVPIEQETNMRIQVCLRKLTGIRMKNFNYEDVAGRQIISALLHETGLANGARGFVYEVIQGAANEARRRGLLLNPNNYDRQTYSTAVGNTERMMPSAMGWAQTKGVLVRHVQNAAALLRRILDERRARLTAAGRTRTTQLKTK